MAVQKQIESQKSVEKISVALKEQAAKEFFPLKQDGISKDIICLWRPNVSFPSQPDGIIARYNEFSKELKYTMYDLTDDKLVWAGSHGGIDPIEHRGKSIKLITPRDAAIKVITTGKISEGEYKAFKDADKTVFTSWNQKLVMEMVDEVYKKTKRPLGNDEAIKSATIFFDLARKEES